MEDEVNMPGYPVLLGGVLINLYETLKLAEAMGLSIPELRDFLRAKGLPPHLINIAASQYYLFFNKTP